MIVIWYSGWSISAVRSGALNDCQHHPVTIPHNINLYDPHVSDQKLHEIPGLFSPNEGVHICNIIYMYICICICI